MKKYHLPLALLLCIISCHTYAGTVALPDAQNVALNFFKVNNPALNGVGLTATLAYTKTEANNAVDFYVFDISPATGFVIVAATDNVIPILGYSTEGHFNTNFSHIGLNHWVNKTAAKIHAAVQYNVAADARTQAQWSAYRQGLDPIVSRSAGVAPLCATTWDQENDVATPPPFLYNLYCPYNNADQQRALTGCVATAMAQVMKRWNYPAHGTGSYSYVDNTANGFSNNYGTQSSDFGAHTYQWSLMPTVLTGTEPAVDDTAVGLLMYDCAVSVGMDFGDDNQDGSGAEAVLAVELQYGDSICSQLALPRYFGYDIDSIRGIVKDSFSSSAWIALIENEMNLGRPVIYEGNDTNPVTGGGHAWVCDGYDAQNYLHMNWGWGGPGNGYFAWDSLYTTASGGPFDPNSDEDALIGIVPPFPTGIKAVSSNVSFSLYPNPASREVILQTNAAESNATWELKNIMGQTLASGNIEAAQTHISVDNVASGVYLVDLRAGENSIVKKLVVSR